MIWGVILAELSLSPQKPPARSFKSAAKQTVFRSPHAYAANLTSNSCCKCCSSL
jgi:hypothetical protein